MTKTDKLLLAFVAALWLTAATSEWVATGSVTITPPDGTVGLVITPDATSPSAAPLHLGAQDTAPSSCAVGDIAVVVNELQICTATNTWTVAGSQS
jgi:hypothetical protein